MSSGYRSVGDLLFRSVRCYSSFSLPGVEDLGTFIGAAAPFGGPIAIVPNPKVLTQLVASGTLAQGMLSIFTAAGVPLSATPLAEARGGARVLGLAWTAAEALAVVYDSGAVDLYDCMGALSPKSFSLLLGEAGAAPGEARSRVEAFAACSGGMAAVVRRPDGSADVLAVYDWAEAQPVVLESAARALGGEAPTALACLGAAHAPSGAMEVLLATAGRSILVVDAEDSCVDQQLDAVLGSVVLVISISAGGRYIATFGEDGVISVLDAGFESKLLEFATKADSRPTQLTWCGEDAVLASFPDRGALLIEPLGQYLSLAFASAATAAASAADAGVATTGLDGAEADLDGGSGNVLMVAEVDGVRVYSAAAHELIQRVPLALAGARELGSSAPVATLLASAAKFDAGDADCDELLRALIADDALKEAVTAAVAAATHEWEPGAQQALLRAAAYGKSFDADFETAVYVDACRRLRLLNALRGYDAGLPLTPAQLEALGTAVVVDRLCARRAYRCALEVCDYLGLVKDRVLVHWACARVRSERGEADEAVCARIRRNLAGVAGVSYADIAAAADSAGRRRLATMILSFEPRVADQVPILLKMREGPLALEKALESGDTDLVYLALLHLRRQHLGAASRIEAGGGPLSGGDEAAHDSFLRVVLAFPAAADLLAAYYRDRRADVALLLRLYQLAGRYADGGYALLAAAAEGGGGGGGGGREALDRQCRLLERAVAAFKEGEAARGAPAAERAACAFARGATEEQLQLLLLQADFDRDAPPSRGEGSYVGATLRSSVARLCGAGELKRAQMLRDSFKLAEASFYAVKVDALARAGNWPALAKFAEERKPPGGFKPFYDACMAAGDKLEAKKYAGRIADYGERIEALCAVGSLVEAAEAATKAKDLPRLEALLKIAKLPAAREAVQKGLELLSGGK